MSHLASPQFIASADIAPSVFVKLSGDDRVDTAGVDSSPIGVMHESIWSPPIPGASATVAVPAGYSKRVYGQDEVCEVIVAAAVTAGQKLMPNASGQGIVATTGKPYGGIVLQGAAIGGRAKIVVSRGLA